MPLRGSSVEASPDTDITGRPSQQFGRIIRNAEGEIIDVQIPGDENEQDQVAADNVTSAHSTRVDAGQSTELIACKSHETRSSCSYIGVGQPSSDWRLPLRPSSGFPLQERWQS